MAVKLSPIFNSQVVDSSGNPASGWKINTYVAGSSTPLATYTDSGGLTAQSNPIVINSLGFPTVGQIWLTSGSTYKLELTNAAGTVQKTEDNISGVNDTSVSSDEWIDSGVTPTYVSTTSFTLVGDQTGAFHVGRRIKSTVTAGTVYGRITASVYGALTTVTLANDGSQTLDSGLSAVQYGILRNNVLSIPARIATAAGTDTYTASVGATRYVTGDEYLINVTNANATSTPTLNFDSLGAKTIKSANGSAVAIGSIVGQMTFRYDGTNMVCLASTIDPGQVQTITATVAASAMTLGYSGGTLSFRSATLTSGAVTTVFVPAITTVISNTSTAGTTSNVPSRIWLAVINNAGTGELAWMNTQLGSGQIAPVNESALITTTAEGAGAADSAGVWYSTTARASVAFRLVGYVESTQATAGVWATSPSVIQGMGDGVRRPGDMVQTRYNVTGAVATGATVMPVDDTIPQSGEGDEYMTQAITPTSAINTLRITHIGSYACGVAGTRTPFALFQDATAGALAVQMTQLSAGGAGIESFIYFEWFMQTGTVSSTTFRIRAGNVAGSTTTFNGSAGARIMGGVMASRMTVSEYMA